MLTPCSAQEWSFQTAAHLLNRAGFGGTPEEIERVRQQGIEAAVDELLHPSDQLKGTDSLPWSAPKNVRGQLDRLKGHPEEQEAKLREIREEQRQELLDLRYWWLTWMKDTRAPLVEKMTLFWHGHFATSAEKVTNTYWLWRQNDTFRRYAFGNFTTLLKEVSRDPAMMIYLDLLESEKSHPNENWAREVMELFTIGIGHYTEQDIRESARAFTGYRIDSNEQFQFFKRQHDETQKRFMGRSGNFSGDDILDIIVEQPACAQFIGRKLWRFFVEDEPPPAAIDSVAKLLRQHHFNLGPVLQAIFSSAEFYAPRVVRAQIKSPVQFLVQSCKLLESELPPILSALNGMQQMGQVLFAPPNVKGWDGGKSWISTATLLFRYNFADYLINGSPNQHNTPPVLRREPIDLGKIIPAELRENSERLVTDLALRLYQSPLAAKQAEIFRAYLNSRATDRGDETIRRLIHLMMSTPQFQLT
jgi:hypothetical protein